MVRNLPNVIAGFRVTGIWDRAEDFTSSAVRL